MRKKSLVILISLLATAATTAWAGQPGEVNPGSTIQTVEARVTGVKECAYAAAAMEISNYMGPGSSAEVKALARALSNVVVKLRGDVTLDVIRHGKNGAVHQVELEANIKDSQLSVLLSESMSLISSDCAADVTADAATSASASADADAGIGASFPPGEDWVELTIAAESSAGADANADASADASADSNASGSGSAEATVDTNSESSATSWFFVQGANIEEFEAEVSMSTRSMMEVNTSALVDVLSEAHAQALAEAFAEAYAEANANASAVLCIDVLGIDKCWTLSESADAASDYDVLLQNAFDAIDVAAAGEAEAISKMLAKSKVDVILTVRYENLPGPADQDLLEILAIKRARLNCDDYISSAFAEAGAGSQ